MEEKETIQATPESVDQQEGAQAVSPNTAPKAKSKKWLFVGLTLLAIFIAVLGLRLFSILPGRFRPPINPYDYPPLPGDPHYSPSPTPDPTADWNTYKNEEYGFEFKYPNILNKTEAEEELKERNSESLDYEHIFSFYSEIEDEATTPSSPSTRKDVILGGAFAESLEDKTLEQLLQETKNDEYKINVKTINIDGTESIRFNELGMAQTEDVYIPVKNRYLEISFTSFGKDEEFYKEQFDQILSTFKFTE
jgi:hypothetical protein